MVYLLNTILEKEEQIGIYILTNLCGENTSWNSESEEITITTQLSIEGGIPDIVINAGDDKLVLIEVKHDSSLGEGQLESYYTYLDGLLAKDKQLVLLTRSRHSIQETSLDRSLFHHVCWYEISGWLSEANFDDEVVHYLTEQFLDFLKEKGMSMEKITWEYIEGIPAMVNLAIMLERAIAEALPEEEFRRTAGWNWIGYYMGEETDIWFGVRYQDPLKIIFENNRGINPTFQRELLLLEVHFFSLTAGEQLECLIEFARNSFQEYSIS